MQTRAVLDSLLLNCILGCSLIENMGNSITQAIKEQQEQNNTEITETLQMMHKMMENKLAASASKVGGIG